MHDFDLATIYEKISAYERRLILIKYEKKTKKMILGFCQYITLSLKQAEMVETREENKARQTRKGKRTGRHRETFGRYTLK